MSKTPKSQRDRDNEIKEFSLDGEQMPQESFSPEKGVDEADKTGFEAAEKSLAEVAVILAAGGMGTRYNAALAGAGSEESKDELRGTKAKQFLTLGDRPVLAHSLDFLESYAPVKKVVLVLPEEYIEEGKALVRGSFGYSKVSRIIAGGSSRQESVARALESLTDWQGIVLIHDGARPLAGKEVYDRVIASTLLRGSGVAAIPARDTIKKAAVDGLVQETIDRKDLWLIQTPQGFMIEDLRKAYKKGYELGLEVTDDAGLMEALGYQVYLVQGHPANIKLTYPEDLDLLTAYLQLM